MRWLVLCLLTGCAGEVDEKTYAERYSPEFCSKTRRCNLGMFESEWSDMNDCIDEVSEDIEDLIDDMDDADCDFDDNDAQDCLDTFAASDCEDYHEGDAFEDCGVNDVWDC